ncbi:hypothetical protein B0H67DRAFT_592113 [Lasiosphaeris hirsuta]|uniref:Uncharacterized protein n=1 Tax=Lasiosphaeris hirsuta TaxID=260670 RepID=A0AA39ZW62_9PEZI|nr:hypothetical protein B0H67DRAFT_592113 [Lasiosphaeris hirsuta]
MARFTGAWGSIGLTNIASVRSGLLKDMRLAMGWEMGATVLLGTADFICRRVYFEPPAELQCISKLIIYCVIISCCVLGGASLCGPR